MAQGWAQVFPTNIFWGIDAYIDARSGDLYSLPWPGCRDQRSLSPGATWRLQLRYARAPSQLGVALNNKLGKEVFHEGRVYRISSSEVTP
jgi:hypothetical protein